MAKIPPATLEVISSIIGGVVEEKAKAVLIDSIATSPLSSTCSDLVLVYDEKFLKDISKIKAKAFILPLEKKDSLNISTKAIIWVQRPRLVFKKLLTFIAPARHFPLKGIHKNAFVSENAVIDESCSVGPGVYIGPHSKIGKNTILSPNVYIGMNVEIGNDCIVFPNVSILDSSKLGKRIIIHSGTVIGADGYSYVTEEESNLEKARKGNNDFNFSRQVQHKIPAIGNVIIEDDVEIGANSCVDRGTFGPTIIGEGTKIDNLVQIAHNCRIGKDCLIVGQAGFAGSVTVGDRVVAGGQTGFADNINIGNDVIFVARSAVHGNIPPMSVYMGMPAVPYEDYFRNERTMKRIPRKQKKLEDDIKLLQDKINRLEEQLNVRV